MNVQLNSSARVSLSKNQGFCFDFKYISISLTPSSTDLRKLQKVNEYLNQLISTVFNLISKQPQESKKTKTSKSKTQPSHIYHNHFSCFFYLPCIYQTRPCNMSFGISLTPHLDLKNSALLLRSYK